MGVPPMNPGARIHFTIHLARSKNAPMCIRLQSRERERAACLHPASIVPRLHILHIPSLNPIPNLSSPADTSPSYAPLCAPKSLNHVTLALSYSTSPFPPFTSPHDTARAAGKRRRTKTPLGPAHAAP